MPVRLVPVLPGKTIKLDKPVLLIGRNPDCDVILKQSRKVSRSHCLIACVENVADKATKALLPDDVNVGRRISDVAEAMGLMVRPIGHLNVMSPALIITEAEVDEIAETLGRAIMQVTDDLVRDGQKVA